MRIKIIAGNLIVVVLITLVSFGVVRDQLTTAIEAETDAGLANDRVLFDRSWRLSASEFVDQTADRARTREIRDVFKGLDIDRRRHRAHEAANRVAAWFTDPARGRAGSPDVVAVTDETGTVLARDTDPNRMFRQRLGRTLGTLRETLKDGKPRHDVWKKDDDRKVLQTALAPIRSEAGTIIGGLVVAYDLSNGLATSEAEVLGREVVFVAGEEIYGSSLKRSVIDGLQDTLFGRMEEATKKALESEGVVTRPWRTELGDRTYQGFTASLPLSPSSDVAYVVLADRTAALAPVEATNIILMMGALGALLVVIFGFVLGSAFTRPIEQMEEGVLAIINGRTDLRLDIESAELGGLAYRINQLVNVFTGTMEEDSEGRVSSPPQAPAQLGGGGGGVWGGDAFGDGGGGGAARPRPAARAGGGGDVVDDPGVAQALAAEDEGAYYGRIYGEYVAAKQALGEDVSNIPQDRFVQRLKGNEAALAKKHGCRLVRFQVDTRGGQVVLKPVLIR